MAIAKNGFQKYHELKNSLIVRGRGLTSQLFSIVHRLNCSPAKLTKEWIKSHQ
jgi:hypothetical protein